MDGEKFFSEWLFQDIKGKESKLFYRDVDDNTFYVNKNKFKEGLGLKALSNHLFLWKTDQEGGEISTSILKWFNSINLIDGSDNDGYVDFTLKQLDNKVFRKRIFSLLRVADFGVEDIYKEEQSMDKGLVANFDIPEDMKELILSDKGKAKAFQIKTKHKKFNQSLKEYSLVDFNLSEESMGTRQFFFISAPILDTLEQGKILLIDEFGASLHPVLTQYLVRIFNDKTINKKNAQLIFATHDTNMLDSTLFRRDQIWFTEKDYYGATHLYSLADHKDIRTNENFEKNYLQGKYGAIPFLGEFRF
jgi:AAA15 family ATPase/GTPase